MQKSIKQLKKLLGVTLAGTMVLPAITGSALVGAALIYTSPDAEAGRTVARSGPRGTTVRHASGPARRPAVAPASAVRGTARRTTRRVARRRIYTLPAGYRAVTRGAYRYYFYSGIYYYPYLISGKTVYVEVDVDASGNPQNPPPASEITSG
jgi:hypothetical protein